MSLYNRGLELEGRGSAELAIRSYRQAIVGAPEFVEAHRAYQNLLLLRHRRGDLVREYRELLAAAPGSAPRRYLLGRLWSDRRRQLEAFDSALLADPTLYFANIGVGYVSLDLGDSERARWAFRRAADLAPERVEARQGQLLTLVARGDPREAGLRVELAERLLEDDPGDVLAERVLLQQHLDAIEYPTACAEAVRFVQDAPSQDAADLVHSVLDHYASSADLLAARDGLAPLDLATDRAGLRLLALVEERAGDPRAALHRVLRAPPRIVDDPDIAALRQRLRLQTGDVAGFTAEVFARRFESGFDLADAGTSRDRFAAVLAALRSEPLSGEPAERAIDGLRSAGLHEAAIELARAALAVDPGQASIEARLAELLAHRRFIAELRQFFEQEYVSADFLGIDGVIDRLRELSRRSLGEDILDPVVQKDFFPIGLFLDPDPANGGGLARYFDRFGTFALIGKRIAGPSEAYVMRRIATSRPIVDGSPVYRVLGENLLVPSRAEFFGAEIAGFAFQSFIALNADRVRSSAQRAFALYDDFGAELLDDALDVAQDADERRDLSEPLSLAVRCHYRALQRFLAAGGERRQLPGLLLDAVEAHERAHIRDATRYLPILKDIGGKLRLLWKHRFSSARVEAWLEQRAQAVALVDAVSPMAVLASTVYFLPERNVSPPHSQGYHDLVRQMIDEVESSPERYPAIDRRYSILPQLDRLGDDELRELGRRVLEDL